MITALTLSLVLVAPAYDYSSMIAAEIGMAVAMDSSPDVSPAPSPVSDICDNCNGRGKVGDGTVFVTCPVCNGTGKKVRTIQVQDDGGPHWTHPGDIKTHLMTSHGYSSAQLAGLTRGQLLTLHDQAHEGRGSGVAARLPTAWTPLSRRDVSLPRPFKGRCLFGRCP